MKKRLIIFLFLFLIFLQISFIQSLPLDNLEGQIEKIEQTQDKLENLKDTNTSYLAEEWKKMIIKNPISGAINNFLEFLSPLFKVLMQEPYTLSWKFFIILLLWIFLFLNLSALLKSSLFEGWIGYALGLIVTLLLAYTGFFKIFYSFLISIVDLFTGWTKWLIIGLIIIAFIILEFFRTYFSKYLRKQKEGVEKEREKTNRSFLNKITSIYKKDI
jgi:hypothetical protein|tara:strand:+ start:65 stop:712 length:648 start_codon:yes stop_codon:yes gene_type:complete